MQKKHMRGDLLLLLTAVIWGSAFVAQSVGMEYIGPFTYQTIRSFLGAVSLLPVIWAANRRQKRAGTYRPMTGAERKKLWLAGLCCGLALGVASMFQQVGVQYTTVGKAGFITAMYILIVPVLGLFFGKKVPLRTWGCIALATAGLYLLCMKDKLSLSMGDGFVGLCALGFSVHILVVDHFAGKLDGLRLSCIQFFVAGLTSLVPMLLCERPLDMGNILAAWAPLLYGGVLSSGVGYTLQVLGQKETKPAVASLLMSLESVFAVLAGIVLLHQVPSAREAIGCVLMFAAIILAQLPGKAIEG